MQCGVRGESRIPLLCDLRGTMALASKVERGLTKDPTRSHLRFGVCKAAARKIFAHPFAGKNGMGRAQELEGVRRGEVRKREERSGDGGKDLGTGGSSRGALAVSLLGAPALIFSRSRKRAQKKCRTWVHRFCSRQEHFGNKAVNERPA